MEHEKRLLFIERLRRTFIIEQGVKYKKIFSARFMMKVNYARFQCCCFCRNESSSEDRDNLVVKEWKDFIEKITAISQADLDDMKEKYIEYKYSYQHYYITNAERNQLLNISANQIDGRSQSPESNQSSKTDPLLPENNSDNQLVKRKNILMEPVLYLLTLDFNKLLTSNLVKEPRMKKGDTEFSLKLTFQAVLKETNDDKLMQGYKNIEDNLLERAKYVCLVLKNFPDKYQYNFHDEQIFLLDAALHLNQKFNIQLIYKLQ